MSNRQHTSGNSNKHPYLIASNWGDGTLDFWSNNPIYSQKTKDFFDAWVSKILKRERCLTRIIKS